MSAEGTGTLPARPIALIGMRGSGKSTVGKGLAARLGRPFLDLDELTRRAGLRAGHASPSAGHLLATVGAARFRDLESCALRLVLEPGLAVVLATGGGIVEREDSRVWLRRAATVVWLDAPAELLAARIAADAERGAERPALQGRDAASEVPLVLARRRPLYRAQADLVVETGARAVADLVESIVASLAAPAPRGKEDPANARAAPGV